jgi:hypothetical protein
MPVFYDIDPTLNLVIYVGSGTITPAEFFNTADMVTVDRRLQDDMKIIIDFFSAKLELSSSDLRLALEKNRQMVHEGRKLGRTAVVTKSSNLKLLADALQLMSTNPIQLGIFHNMQDALRWLGLSEMEKEAIRFVEGIKTRELKDIKIT